MDVEKQVEKNTNILISLQDTVILHDKQIHEQGEEIKSINYGLAKHQDKQLMHGRRLDDQGKVQEEILKRLDKMCSSVESIGQDVSILTNGRMIAELFGKIASIFRKGVIWISTVITGLIVMWHAVELVFK